MNDAGAASDAQQAELRMLARAVDRAGLATAFGHCSLRLDPNRFLVCAAKPMGLIAAGEPGSVAPIDGPLPGGVLGEVRMHREIYARRPDVNAIVRFISPSVTALAALGRSPRPRHGVGSYFSPVVPMWADPGLVRNDPAARGVAETMGNAPAVVVSVNGAVAAGATAAQALALGIFLEDAARIELLALGVGGNDLPQLSEEQARSRATWEGRVAERLWDYWTAGDPEQPA